MASYVWIVILDTKNVLFTIKECHVIQINSTNLWSNDIWTHYCPITETAVCHKIFSGWPVMVHASAVTMDDKHVLFTIDG